jgi:DNA polymerase elongation subunit (family B)
MDKKIGTLIKIVPSKRQVLTNSVEFDSLLVIYRDEKGQKKTRFIDRVKVPYYIIKDKESAEALNPPMFIEKDKVEKSETYTDLLYREIAAKTDSMSYYDKISTNYGGDNYSLKNLFKHPWVYDSDMDYGDRYIAMFNEEFEPDMNYRLHKCYFDIEVDIMPDGWKKDAKGNVGFMGFPDEENAPVPVNIITLFDEKSMQIHTFVVRNQKNDTLKEFEASVEEFKKYLIDKLDIEDDVEIKGVNISFYNSEEEAIEAFFKTVHGIDPDYILAWNAGFDIQTLQNRLRKLYAKKGDSSNGYNDMLNTVCDPKYMVHEDKLGDKIYLPPRAYYKAQKGKKFIDRIDVFNVLDGINWLDQIGRII